MDIASGSTSVPPPQAEAPEASGQLRLYISGSTPNSLRAQQSVRGEINAMGGRRQRLGLQLIDVFAGTKRAIADGVLVTPTLIAQFSGRRVVIVGDLSDRAALRSVLEGYAEATG